MPREPALQTQIPALDLQSVADPGNSLRERSHKGELGFFPGDGGVRVGLQVPEDWSGLLCEARFRDWKLGPAAPHHL